jgi:hypothetical protein
VRETQGWHAGDIFGHRDTFGVELVQHLVREGEVGDALLVDSWAEVLVVATREASVGVLAEFKMMVVDYTYVPMPWCV